MVVLNKIYTRTGDAGETALGNGVRVAKHSARVAAYGTVDETNATVGLARLHSAGVMGGEMDRRLARIQNDLFDLGADLCRPEMASDAGAEHPPLRVTPAQVERLEREIDAMNAGLQPLRSFVLPGGSAAAAALHMARTICRRAERVMVSLAGREPGKVGEAGLHYINRLSDLLFVASRWVNDKGEADVLWVPGKNR